MKFIKQSYQILYSNQILAKHAFTYLYQHLPQLSLCIVLDLLNQQEGEGTNIFLTYFHKKKLLKLLDLDFMVANTSAILLMHSFHVLQDKVYVIPEYVEYLVL